MSCFVSEMTALQGDPGSAYALMLDAARKSNSARLYERAIEIAYRARSGEAALQAAQAWGPRAAVLQGSPTATTCSCCWG